MEKRKGLLPAYPTFLFVLLFFVWAWAAWNPVDPDAWLLENVIVIIAVPLFVIAGRYFRFSNLSYSLITLFLIFHLVGSHYTYAETPLGFPLGEWWGVERNMYDRLVHFSFGLLMAYPVREFLFRVARMRGFWSYFLPLDMTLSISAVYELIEWGIVEFYGSAAGIAFLATQGDMWDAQKDIGLAALGALVTLSIIGIFNWRYSHEFRTEIKESFSLHEKHTPESEVQVRDIIKKKREAYRDKRHTKKEWDRTEKKHHAYNNQKGK